MKKILVIALLFISANSFSQIFYENIEPMSITKPEMENETIDPSVFTDLEKFNNENDAFFVIKAYNMKFDDMNIIAQREYIEKLKYIKKIQYITKE